MESGIKENIPPLPSISANQTKPVPSSKKTFKRRSRVPLADITNIFTNSVQTSSDQENINGVRLLPSSVPVPVSVSVSTSNPRKRKAAEDIDLKEGTSAKSWRMEFR
ncbi:hypothetical protein OWV82_002429 [Melia azedarach]|uniref:Uncharacterized protein n=1 Tax=Melia azedarach TaxID=155640 RepID=A0ACC1Z2L4_MELAZ|nr:hypothetical protein OWV82_002429 [Melia azedarach]